jgi:hypothetical protein
MKQKEFKRKNKSNYHSVYDMMLYLKDHKYSIKKLLDLLLAMQQDIKLTCKTKQPSNIPTMNRQRKKSGKQSHLK